MRLKTAHIVPLRHDKRHYAILFVINGSHVYAVRRLIGLVPVCVVGRSPIYDFAAARRDVRPDWASLGCSYVSKISQQKDQC